FINPFYTDGKTRGRRNFYKESLCTSYRKQFCYNVVRSQIDSVVKTGRDETCNLPAACTPSHQKCSSTFTRNVFKKTFAAGFTYYTALPPRKIILKRFNRQGQITNVDRVFSCR